MRLPDAIAPGGAKIRKGFTMGIGLTKRSASAGARLFALLLVLGGTLFGIMQTSRAADTDYPELDIVATDQGIQAPSITFAARYRVVFKNEGTINHGLSIIQPPDGKTIEDALFGPPQSDVQFFQTTKWQGGPGMASPGHQTEAIVDLKRGLYGLMDPGLAEQETGDWLRLLIVSPGQDLANDPADSPEPTADQTIVLHEMKFDGLPAEVPAGKQIWKVTNSGMQTHELYIAKAPDGTTIDQLRAALSAGRDTPVPAGGLDLEKAPQGAMGPLSPGVTGWAVLDLEPGTYVAFCIMPDSNGMSHASEGMTAVFTVS
jgi:uncharacterized cupredoxin-like copper-binding protein